MDRVETQQVGVGFHRRQVVDGDDFDVGEASAVVESKTADMVGSLKALGLKPAQITATNISISPMLEPTQWSPNSNPEWTFSRQRRRKSCLSGVNS